MILKNHLLYCTKSYIHCDVLCYFVLKFVVYHSPNFFFCEKFKICTMFCSWIIILIRNRPHPLLKKSNVADCDIFHPFVRTLTLFEIDTLSPNCQCTLSVKVVLCLYRWTIPSLCLTRTPVSTSYALATLPPSSSSS